MHQNVTVLRILNMGKDYKKLFSGLENPGLPAGLYGSVLARIDNEARRLSLIRLAIFVPLVLISSVAVVTSFQYLVEVSAQSGLSEYLSILFSDSGTVLSYWKEFLLLIAEQAPVLGAALFLGAVLAFAGSLRSAIKNAQTVFTHIQLAI